MIILNLIIPKCNSCQSSDLLKPPTLKRKRLHSRWNKTRYHLIPNASLFLATLCFGSFLAALLAAAARVRLAEVLLVRLRENRLLECRRRRTFRRVQLQLDVILQASVCRRQLQHKHIEIRIRTRFLAHLNALRTQSRTAEVGRLFGALQATVARIGQHGPVGRRHAGALRHLEVGLKAGRIFAIAANHRQTETVDDVAVAGGHVEFELRGM